jgi:hypothetical protein
MRHLYANLMVAALNFKLSILRIELSQVNLSDIETLTTPWKRRK